MGNRKTGPAKQQNHILGLLLVFMAWRAGADPLQLTVKPQGTNQVELTLHPVIQNNTYGVLVRSNGPAGHWIVFGSYVSDSNDTFSVTADLPEGITLQTLANWRFAAGTWYPSGHPEFPPMAKELIFRNDPTSTVRPNNSLLEDGWSNQDKFKNNWDPFVWHEPEAPWLHVQFDPRANVHQGKAILIWNPARGILPDYFLVQRANHSLSRETNDLSAGQSVVFETVARVASQLGVRNYHFIDTNAGTSIEPGYRVVPHYVPPPHAHLSQVNAAAIRKTILPVAAEPDTNGYALTVAHPIPNAWYLLLVRDKRNPQWRASGYFASGTNDTSVQLHVDRKGMMAEGQNPIAMPEMHFLPDTVNPEFTAGWGEDSDGDGLPDIYEVLVTHTAPDNADTGNTGTMDGYKNLSGDGWSNLEKFRRRSDPMKQAYPPPPVELPQPTVAEVLKAVAPKTDLRYEWELSFRMNASIPYQSIERAPIAFDRAMYYKPPAEHGSCDVRVSWRMPSDQPFFLGEPDLADRPGAGQTMEFIEQEVSLRLMKSFWSKLATNPPLSRMETSNAMAAIYHAYRQDEVDKGVAMMEMMTVTDNQAQDFYGRVIDQYGEPVAGADVIGQTSLGMGRGRSCKTQTDGDGLFQFTGIRGASLGVMPKKEGFQIEGHGLGLKGKNGPETSPDHRAVYTMWKLKGPEPMWHSEVANRKLQSDGRMYTIDFLKSQITEGTNAAGDMLIQMQRPAQVKPREKYDWALTMTAIRGGFIEVTNDDYLNEAPEGGYQPEFKLNAQKTFYLKSRNGQVYGHFSFKELSPDYRGRGPAAIQIEYYVNPAGSRNLEFDQAKQLH